MMVAGDGDGEERGKECRPSDRKGPSLPLLLN